MEYQFRKFVHAIIKTREGCDRGAVQTCLDKNERKIKKMKKTNTDTVERSEEDCIGIE